MEHDNREVEDDFAKKLNSTIDQAYFDTQFQLAIDVSSEGQCL
jgi:hypothetical protein